MSETSSLPTLPILPLGFIPWLQLHQRSLNSDQHTAQVLRLVQSYRQVFIARPHLMGKTTLISKLHELFTIESGDGHKYFGQNKSVPCDAVITLSGNALYGDDAETVARSLMLELGRAYREADFLQVTTKVKKLLTASDAPAETKLGLLLMELSKIATKQELVFLVDDWDYPLRAHLDDESRFNQIAAVLRGFYHWLSASSPKFLFITGIMRDPVTGIVSGTQIQDLSMDPRWADLIGIPEAEVKTLYAPYLEVAAQRLNCSKEQLVTRLKYTYGGFCFDREGKVKLYSPFDLNHFFTEVQTTTSASLDDFPFESYWSKNAPAGLDLRSLIARYKFNLLQLLALPHDSIACYEEQLQRPNYMALEQPLQLLTVLGFLALCWRTEPKAQNLQTTPWCCALTNLAVNSYYRTVLHDFLYDNLGLHTRTAFEYYEQEMMQMGLWQGLDGGNVETVCAHINQFLSKIRFDAFSPWDSKAIYSEILALWFNSQDLTARTGTANNRGRSDLEVETSERKVYVFELRFIEPELQDTLLATNHNDEACPDEAKSAALQQLDQAVLSPGKQYVLDRGYGINAQTMGASSITGVVLAIDPQQHRIVAGRSFNKESDELFWAHTASLATI